MKMILRRMAHAIMLEMLGKIVRHEAFGESSPGNARLAEI